MLLEFSAGLAVVSLTVDLLHHCSHGLLLLRSRVWNPSILELLVASRTHARDVYLAEVILARASLGFDAIRVDSILSYERVFLV